MRCCQTPTRNPHLSPQLWARERLATSQQLYSTWHSPARLQRHHLRAQLRTQGAAKQQPATPPPPSPSPPSGPGYTSAARSQPKQAGLAPPRAATAASPLRSSFSQPSMDTGTKLRQSQPARSPPAAAAVSSSPAPYCPWPLGDTASSTHHGVSSALPFPRGARPPQTLTNCGTLTLFSNPRNKQKSGTTTSGPPKLPHSCFQSSVRTGLS